MSEPLTVAAGVAAGSAGITFASLFPEATPAVMICALAGAALYVLTTDNHQFWKQVVFAFISFIGGIYCAEFVSHILTGMINAFLLSFDLHMTILIPPAVGALVSAVICVTALLKILSRTRNYLNDKPKGDAE